jgi:outer membrane protein
MLRSNLVAIVLFGTLAIGMPANANEPIVLNLDDAIKTALARDELVRQAQQSVNDARNYLIRVRAHTPQLSVGSSTSASSSAGLNPESEVTGTEYSSQGYGIGVNVPLEDGTSVNLSTSASTSTTNSKLSQGGGTEYTYADVYAGLSISKALPLLRDERLLNQGSRKSAEFSLQSAELFLEDARRNVAADTFSYYFNAVRAKRQSEIADMTQAETDELLRIAQEKLDLGMIPEIDMMEAQVSADSARTAVRQRQSNLATELDQLKNYLGIPLDQDLKLADSGQAMATTDLHEEELVNLAFEKRADLRRLGLQVKSAELALRQTKAQSKPGVYLTGLYGKSGGGSTISAGLQNLINPNWNIGLSTSFSLSHEEDQAAIDEAAGILHLSQTEEHLYRDKIRLEIRRLLREMEDADANIALLSKTVKRAEENLSIRQVQLGHGLTRAIDVMQTERQLEEARRQYADALTDGQLIRMQLNMAVGEMPSAAEKLIGVAQAG